MTAREQILGDIRKALGRAEGQPPLSLAANLDPLVALGSAPLAAPVLRIPKTDRNHYTTLFVQNLEKLAGKAIIVKNSAAVVPALSELLEGKLAVASNAPMLEKCGLTRLAGVQSGFMDRAALRAACSTADLGITSVDYALAETGTFVMLSSPREARLISLLPPVHVAIVPRARILGNLDELLGLIPKPADQTSSMVLITGPSRTADIEQILIRGVHGPGEVYAVIVEEEE